MPRRGSQASRPLLKIPPRGRGGALASVAVALEGAAPSELREALALARAYGARPRLVAVDGGLTTCRALRKRPDLFVGDLDSSTGPPRGVLARLYPAVKDFSDFAGALTEIRRMGADLVVVAGLIGGRLDHEWANLAEIGVAAPRFAAILAPTRRGLVAVTARGFEAHARAGSLVSIFAVRREARVSLGGAAWSLHRRRLPPGSLGLSNVVRGALSLTVHAGVVAAVFPETPRSPAPRGRGRGSPSNAPRGARSSARA